MPSNPCWPSPRPSSWTAPRRSPVPRRWSPSSSGNSAPHSSKACSRGPSRIPRRKRGHAALFVWARLPPPWRPTTLICQHGEVQFTRPYWRCPACGQTYAPADTAGELPPGNASWGVRAMAALVGALVPQGEAWRERQAAALWEDGPQTTLRALIALQRDARCRRRPGRRRGPASPISGIIATGWTMPTRGGAASPVAVDGSNPPSKPPSKRGRKGRGCAGRPRMSRPSSMCGVPSRMATSCWPVPRRKPPRARPGILPPPRRGPGLPLQHPRPPARPTRHVATPRPPDLPIKQAARIVKGAVHLG